MFDLEQMTRIVDGRICGIKTNISLSSISTDSRNIEPGALFIPLRGDHFDGHDYISQAVKNGAAACLSEEIVEGLSVPVLCVDNTLKALGDIAAAYRLQLNGPLVGITGSVGKTTTKEMLASILTQVAPGLKTAGNFNNLIGLPLTLMRIEKKHKWAVIEMGTSALGEIERLTKIARPSLGIITNIGAAHLETLHGLDGVARAKGELFAGLQGGTALVNIDDEYVARLPLANGVKRLTYGLSSDAQIRAGAIKTDSETVHFSLFLNEQEYRVCLSLPGCHNVLNALAAAAAAYELKVPAEKIVAGLEQFVPAQGRMNLCSFARGGLLLDDSYNSNPMSAAAALEALQALDGQGRKVAVLGDMLELGAQAPQLHRKLGAKAAAVVDCLIAVGHYAHDVCDGAQSAGLKVEHQIALADVDAAIDFLQQKYRSDDRILVKGSRGIKLDRLVTVLKASEPLGKEA
jgi:UDP-N-acetylmuramoyl-tripeptide--D-alanyl-D-alanine ligase